jgi:hypothetical protein
MPVLHAVSPKQMRCTKKDKPGSQRNYSHQVPELGRGLVHADVRNGARAAGPGCGCKFAGGGSRSDGPKWGGLFNQSRLSPRSGSHFFQFGETAWDHHGPSGEARRAFDEAKKAPKKVAKEASKKAAREAARPAREAPGSCQQNTGQGSGQAGQGSGLGSGYGWQVRASRRETRYAVAQSAK